MADKRWIGAALDVAQSDSIAFSLDWAQNDTVTLTINNQAITITLGSTVDTAAEVASAVAEVINSQSHQPADLTADVTTNFGGQEVPEFRDVEASVSSATVTVVSRSPGVPFTLAVSFSTAGTGTLSHGAQDVAPTGKNHFDDVDNWESGSLPAAGDTLVFDHGNVSVLYGLNNAVLDYGVRCTPEYAGEIGLPKVNVGNYPEYRQRFLVLPCTAATGSHTVDLDGPGSKRIDLGTNTGTPLGTVVRVNGGQGPGPDGRNVQIVGGGKVSLYALGGSLEVGDHPAETETNILGYWAFGDCNVKIGTNTTFENTGNAVNHNSGKLDFYGTVDGASAIVRIHGGEVTIRPEAEILSYMQYGGTVDWRGFGFDEISIFGGVFDASKCPYGPTFTATFLSLFRGSTYKDPHDALAIPLSFVGCTPADVHLELRQNLKFSIGAAPSTVIQ